MEGKRLWLGAMILLMCWSANLRLAAQAEKPFEVIAYYSGNGDNIHQYPLQHLTQIIFSFLHLKGDTLHFSSKSKREALRKVVRMKQQYPRCLQCRQTVIH